ncbi:MAG: acetyl-CoA acetyltransferase, partial [Pseudomonadota bacterium]
EDLDYVELYSCFPCMPKMARRVLDWPLERDATTYGGLTFGGGPIANCMTHAIAAMTRKLRGTDKKGLIFANGGLATNSHAIILGRDPGMAGSFPQDFNVQAEADAQRAAPPKIDEAYEGPGVIETYTVLFDRNGAPTQGIIVARSPDAAKRFLAIVPASDEAGIAFLTDGRAEPVGSEGQAVAIENDMTLWTIGR